MEIELPSVPSPTGIILYPPTFVEVFHIGKSGLFYKDPLSGKNISASEKEISIRRARTPQKKVGSLSCKNEFL